MNVEFCYKITTLLRSLHAENKYFNYFKYIFIYIIYISSYVYIINYYFSPQFKRTKDGQRVLRMRAKKSKTQM